MPPGMSGPMALIMDAIRLRARIRLRPVRRTRHLAGGELRELHGERSSRGGFPAQIHSANPL
eukprot:4956235-Prymnesium_polylepis.1